MKAIVVWRRDSCNKAGTPTQHLVHPNALYKESLCGARPWFEWRDPHGFEPKCSKCQELSPDN